MDGEDNTLRPWEWQYCNASVDGLEEAGVMKRGGEPADKEVHTVISIATVMNNVQRPIFPTWRASSHPMGWTQPPWTATLLGVSLGRPTRAPAS